MRSGRNLLTLHARLDARSFDLQSTCFEREMLDSLGKVFRSRFQNVKTSAQLPKSIGGEELDLIVIDDSSQTVFLGEARATIMPADPSEVFRRLTEIERKITQLQRKIRSVRAHLTNFLAWAGANGRVDDWQVVGCVILRGHAGALTAVPEIPVVPEQIISAGVSAISSVKCLHQWLASHSWLPQPGIHFKTIPTSHRLGEFEVKFGGVKDLKPFDFLRNHLPASLLGFSK
jgi:hypothetical protein